MLDIVVLKLKLNVTGDDHFNLEEAIAQLNPGVQQEDNEIQDAVDFLTNEHPKLRDMMFEKSMPKINIEGLSIFQRLLKCLLYSVTNQFTRSTIYQEIEKYCQRQGNQVSPQSIIDIPESELGFLGVKNHRTATIIQFARVYGEGNLLSDDLCRELPDELLLHNLDHLGGVGYITGLRMLLFGLRRLDFIPAQDPLFRKAWKEYHELKKAPSKEDIRMDTTWAPYRAVASYIVWVIGGGAS